MCSLFIIKRNEKKLTSIIKRFKQKNIRTSLFIDANISDIYLSKKIDVHCIEIHTGKLANLVKAKKNYQKEFLRIKKCARLAKKLGIEVHAGHGLDYKVTKLLCKIKEIRETIMKMGFQKPVQFDLNSSFFLIQKDDT